MGAKGARRVVACGRTPAVPPEVRARNAARPFDIGEFEPREKVGATNVAGVSVSVMAGAVGRLVIGA